MKVITPEPLRRSFTCPHCDTTAVHDWYVNLNARGIYPFTYGDYVAKEEEKGLYACLRSAGGMVHDTVNPELAHWGISECSNCHGLMIWHDRKIVYPEVCPVEDPNGDMPNEVRDVYLEAASVFSKSPRSAAALLRLSLQLLLKDILGEESKPRIYDDLQTLVAKGANAQIIKVMDIIRFEGNESVHPGEINLNDDPDTASALFTFINMIVEQFYSEQRRIDELYERIPKLKRVN